MGEPSQRAPSMPAAPPLPPDNDPLDAALRARCTLAGFPEIFISRGSSAKYGAELGANAGRALVALCVPAAAENTLMAEPQAAVQAGGADSSLGAEELASAPC